VDLSTLPTVSSSLIGTESMKITPKARRNRPPVRSICEEKEEV